MSTLNPCELFDHCMSETGGSGHWRRFIDRHGGQVRSVVRLTARRCKLPLSPPDLDELVQELYCRLWSARGRGFRGRSEAQLWSFLSRVAHNLVVDRQRSLGARKRRPREGVEPTSRLLSPKADPEERLLNRERRLRFLELCREIARGDRAKVELRALSMACLEGWTSREIAGRLGRLSAGQVDVLVHRLRRHLAKEGIRLPRRYCVPASP